MNRHRRRLLWVFLVAFTAFVLPVTGQQQASSSPIADQTPKPRTIPWRRFGPQPAEIQQAEYKVPDPAPPQPTAVSSDDRPADNAASPSDVSSSPQAPAASSDATEQQAASGVTNSPETPAAPTAATLLADFEKREQDRNQRRQELEAAAHNDPSLQSLTDIQTTRLLLEGEQDRMNSSEQLSRAFTDLAAKVQSQAYQVRALLNARRRTADQADEEIARISAEIPDLNLALHNVAMLPASAENDEFMKQMDNWLRHREDILKTDQERSQQAHVQIKALEADEQELDGASRQARVKSVAFAQASQDAKLNQDLLANRLEFSTQHERASDELLNTRQLLQTPVSMSSNSAIPEAALGGGQPEQTEKPIQQEDTLRDCIRQTGDVAACRAAGEQP